MATRVQTGMEMRPFGPTKRKVSVIGQGTWFLERAGRERAVATLRHGLDLGMNHIDTAELYGSGLAEEFVGEAIAGRRDEVFLVSKVLPSNATAKGTVLACENSLKRLKTPWLDCYLLHWRGAYALGPTIEGFEYLQLQGKIRSWGVSNLDVADLEEVRRLAGAGHIACNQVLYHLRERGIEHAVLPWCEKHGVAVVGYSPFGHDSFPEPGSAQGRVLQQIAARHGATPRQVALRFLVRQPSLFTIPKASSPEHAEENAGGASLQLTEDEIALIQRTFPLGPRPRTLPVL